MITLHTHRNYIRAVKLEFFQYINLYKTTRLNNLAHKGPESEEYLSAIMINCLLTQIEISFEKKLINTAASFVKIKLSDAEAVALYVTLLKLPIDQAKEYLQMIRNEWIHILHKQLSGTDILKVSTYKPDAATTWSDYFDV